VEQCRYLVFKLKNLLLNIKTLRVMRLGITVWSAECTFFIVILSIIVLRVIIFSVVLLRIVILYVIILSVNLLSVFVLSVMVPRKTS
jgi:hypothetical protein